MCECLPFQLCWNSTFQYIRYYLHTIHTGEQVLILVAYLCVPVSPHNTEGYWSEIGVLWRNVMPAVRKHFIAQYHTTKIARGRRKIARFLLRDKIGQQKLLVLLAVWWTREVMRLWLQLTFTFELGAIFIFLNIKMPITWNYWSDYCAVVCACLHENACTLYVMLRYILMAL